MNVELFAQQIQNIHWRLAQLYEGAENSLQPTLDWLLPTAFKELGTASEELQVAVEELHQQTEKLETLRAQVEAERQRYQNLFEFMPCAYLVTDVQGKIIEANHAASTLLNVEQRFLPDKLLVSFIPPQERRAFRAKLAQLDASDFVQEWIVRLQPRQGELLDASMSVAVVRNSQGNSISLRWIVRDVTQQRRELRVLQSNDYNPCEDRPKYLYCKGEIIPLESQAVWLVHRGLVKLTTMGERGEEILVGLVGPSLPFSAGMTSLNTYQATALSEKVELVSIPLSEIAASSRLSQAIVPKINQRLRQTEFLLAISGRRQIKERLDYLLLFLKKEIGQKVAQGTRFKVRLTHQDLADACGTTRVTITRLLGKLQKEGKIAFDSKHHIILRDINN